MTTLNRMDSRPMDARGYRVPWFVAWLDGQADFRIVGPGKFKQAIQQDLCWACGGKLGAHKAFVIGPMCGINRTSAEPPCHLECAEYSATHCPFLINPAAVRRETKRPEGTKNPAGIMIKRNLGVTLIWVTKSYELFRADGGYLIEIGEPKRLIWYAKGRPATREEVYESIESGCHVLREVAEKESKDALQEYEKRKQWILERIPTA